MIELLDVLFTAATSSTRGMTIGALALLAAVGLAVLVVWAAFYG